MIALVDCLFFVLSNSKCATTTCQWRKTEPLENAFMIMAFEAEPTWKTPGAGGSGGNASKVVTRARPLMRQTPGAPGMAGLGG
jgi:hypothetical protein